VKIAAISPQFVVETPAGEETTDAEKTSAELRLQVVRAREVDKAAADGSAIEAETREGLKRLSRLIRKKEKPSTSVAERRPSDQRQKRAFAVYRKISSCADPQDELGQQLDEIA
jgi:hypothetical protein